MAPFDPGLYTPSTVYRLRPYNEDNQGGQLGQIPRLSPQTSVFHASYPPFTAHQAPVPVAPFSPVPSTLFPSPPIYSSQQQSHSYLPQALALPPQPSYQHQRPH